MSHERGHYDAVDGITFVLAEPGDPSDGSKEARRLRNASTSRTMPARFGADRAPGRGPPDLPLPELDAEG